MTRYTFPQNGDTNYAEDFAAWFGVIDLLGDHADSDLSLNVDYGVPDVSVSSRGKVWAAVPTAQNGEGEDRHDGVYMANIDTSQSVSLTDNDTNHVYVDLQVDTDDSAQLVANTTGTAPSDDSVKVAEVDTSGNSKTEFNRRPDIDVHDLKIDGTTIDSDHDGTVDQADDALAYKGNDIDTDGDGTVDNAENVTSTYKGNDIDSDGDGKVDNADKLDGSELSDITYSDILSFHFGSGSTSTSDVDVEVNTVSRIYGGSLGRFNGGTFEAVLSSDTGGEITCFIEANGNTLASVTTTNTSPTRLTASVDTSNLNDGDTIKCLLDTSVDTGGISLAAVTLTE